MDGGAGELHPVLQGLLVDVEAVAAGAGEGGDKGGVDVQDGVGVGLHHLPGEDDHESGQHHQVDARLLQLVHQGHGHGLVGGVLLPGHHTAGNARLGGPLQGVGAGGGGDHQDDLAIDDLPPGLGVNEGL